MSFTDGTKIQDVVRTALGGGNFTLPKQLPCPNGHMARLYHIETEMTVDPIPAFVCESCGVVYRYQELRSLDATNKTESV